jgi:hypothetical protein
MEELVEKLGEGMRLLEGEKASIVITEDDTADQRLRNGRCLVGRIMSERRVQKEAFKAFMARLWKTTGKVAFKELEDNFWLLEFSSEAEKKRVQEGCPWLFDRNILILKEVEDNTPPAQMDFSKSPCWIQVRDIPLICINKEVGNKIGETIGEVEEVDISGEGPGRGCSLRIKVHIDITKPLDKGRALWLNGKMVWVNFRYEKLPHFCFNCGRIFHNKEQCSDQKGPSQENDEAPKRWGTWLRAEEVRFTQGKMRPGGGRASSPLQKSFIDQKGGDNGGEAAPGDQQEAERGEPQDQQGGDPNKSVRSHSIGNDIEKQILQSILRREVRDTKAAETGHTQSPNRRCDFMELMLTSDLLDKADYPLVHEESFTKADGDRTQEAIVGDSVYIDSVTANIGPTGGLGVGKEGNQHLEDGSGMGLDPQGTDSGYAMADIEGDNSGQGKGPIRRWKRRIRSSSLSPDQTRGGKRGSVQAGIGEGEDSTEGGKKARLDVETGIDLAWAEAGFQPRQPQ